jgi:hypothetical protein
MFRSDFPELVLKELKKTDSKLTINDLAKRLKCNESKVRYWVRGLGGHGGQLSEYVDVNVVSSETFKKKERNHLIFLHYNPEKAKRFESLSDTGLGSNSKKGLPYFHSAQPQHLEKQRND